jgi:ABC-2 type transport system permease protein
MSRYAAFAWSVRRELWEHRAIVVAPLVLAALIVAAFAYHAGTWGDALRTLPPLDEARRTKLALTPFALAASAILLCGWIVALFFALDALHGERRDRSILFWKSMPVPDTTAVVAKLVVALFVAPLIAWGIAVAAQLAMAVAGSVRLASAGLDAAWPWTLPPWLPTTLTMIYGVVAHSLWFAPIAGYLLLVSAWARRTPFLWAVLPILAALAVERIAFGTTHVAALVKHRLVGGLAAFRPDALKEPITDLAQLDPLRFLALPGLWLGLAFAAASVVAAIRLRRYREPN